MAMIVWASGILINVKNLVEMVLIKIGLTSSSLEAN